jgi:hypothetical protein
MLDKQFELQINKQIEIMGETFLTRLENEKKELLTKTTDLLVFIESEKFDDLSDANQLLLNQQIIHMNEYLNILIIRIELLKK